ILSGDQDLSIALDGERLRRDDIRQRLHASGAEGRVQGAVEADHGDGIPVEVRPGDENSPVGQSLSDDAVGNGHIWLRDAVVTVAGSQAAVGVETHESELVLRRVEYHAHYDQLSVRLQQEVLRVAAGDRWVESEGPAIAKRGIEAAVRVKSY